MAATMLRSATRCRNFERISSQIIQNVRHRSSLPMNTIILFVPQQEAWIVERMGKFQRTLEPGLNWLLPVIDSVKYVQSLKEIAIDIPKQSAITIDNVTLTLDGVLYLKVFDPYKASYGVEDAEYAISQLAQTTLRSEIGKILLDTVFRERDSLNIAIVDAINKAAESWGIRCMRYEIRDIKLPNRVQDAMQMQVEAERKKRASILESEGIRESEINVAEGKKQSKILSSEGWKTEQVNTATGEAEALTRVATARAEAIIRIAEAIGRENGHNAVSLRVAEEYIQAFGKIAKEGNTILLPSNTGDISSMVSQAMAIYNTVGNRTIPPASSPSTTPAKTVDKATHHSEPKDPVE